MMKLETRNSKFVTAGAAKLESVRDFKDLLVWKLARELRLRVYDTEKKFPPEERYALKSQLRRTVQSIGANIAEGFGRYSYRENIQYCQQARGSAFEVRDHLVTAIDAEFVSKDEYIEADTLAQRAMQALTAIFDQPAEDLPSQRPKNRVNRISSFVFRNSRLRAWRKRDHLRTG